MNQEENKLSTQSTYKTPKVLDVLKYIGFIGAGITMVAYLVAIVILINGLKIETKTQDVIIFAVINALLGFVILQFFKIQGQTYAKNIPENKILIEQYYSTKTKDKKLRSMKYYWVKSTIIDICTKILTVAIASATIIITIKGNQQWELLLLAVANMLMFGCFGLIGLTQSYEFYNNNQVPYMREQLKVKEEKCLQSTTNNTEI